MNYNRFFFCSSHHSFYTIGLPSGLTTTVVQSSLTSRQNFKKSHNCVSLFAKCNCKDDRRNKKVLQSYVHPDTAFVFTDENKNATISRERKYTVKNRSAQLQRSKRLSTPNFGNYTILDVAGKFNTVSIMVRIHSKIKIDFR